MRPSWSLSISTRRARTGNRTRIICLEGRCAGRYTTRTKAKRCVSDYAILAYKSFPSDSNRASASQAQRAAITPRSQKQLQRESNPRPRIDSPAYWPLYYEAIFSMRAGEFRPAFQKQCVSVIINRTFLRLSPLLRSHQWLHSTPPPK